MAVLVIATLSKVTGRPIITKITSVYVDKNMKMIADKIVTCYHNVRSQTLNTTLTDQDALLVY